MSEQSKECVFKISYCKTSEAPLCSECGQSQEHVHSDETEPVSPINNSQSHPVTDLSPPVLSSPPDLIVFEKSLSPEESSNDNGNHKEVELDIISYPESLNQQINLPKGPNKSLNDTTSLYETSNEDISPPHLALTVFEISSPEESSNDNENLKVDIISYSESLNQQINLPMGPSKSSNDATSLYETSNEDLSPKHLHLHVFEKSSATEESCNDNGNDKEAELHVDIISYPESPISLPMGPSKSLNNATSLYETSNEDISEKPSSSVSLHYYRFYNYNILDS